MSEILFGSSTCYKVLNTLPERTTHIFLSAGLISDYLNGLATQEQDDTIFPKAMRCIPGLIQLMSMSFS